MPIPDLANRDAPFGPLRDKQTVTVPGGGDDYVNPSGFICVAVGQSSAYDLSYRTLEGIVDQTESIPTAGATIAVAGIPVVLTAVRAHTSDDRTIVIGLL